MRRQIKQPDHAEAQPVVEAFRLSGETKNYIEMVVAQSVGEIVSALTRHFEETLRLQREAMEREFKKRT